MANWSRSLQVNAPAAAAWEQLVDTTHWSSWGPSVTGARVDGGPGSRIGPGATGAVRTPVGVWIPYTVTQWTEEPDELRWGWRVAGVPATGHWVRPTGADSCEVGMDVPVWAPAYLAIIEVALRRIRRSAESVR
ncbi:SRPBCC family protein [Nocardioides salsibiostraticola]